MEFGTASELRVNFCACKRLNPHTHRSISTDHSKAVPLLGLFFICANDVSYVTVDFSVCVGLGGLDARLTGDQEVADSIPARSGNILS